MAAKPKEEDTRRGQVKDFLGKNPTFVLTLLYLYATAIGMYYSAALYSKFGINIFDFAEMADFLLATFKNPIALLLELISRGMADCTPTLRAVGEAGDFRFGNDPGCLVGAANYQLALFVARKKRIRECRECGEPFPPTNLRQREHTRCGNRRRKREQREREKAESSL